ncbi:MAG: hypothetical protein GYA55_12925 [SAR324 cluster bacterium]|uniref:Type 4 fimbrial biogenesis protein PilX N-terminal domain-containing protein n=1 Tax=SAR324 cluster bacterium TaxID=2024889 RepID=A0A7X9FUK5_9DELT|nr:hypothetical protein [SAR324 cluster bacterium]
MKERGFAIVVTLFLLGALAAILGAYALSSRLDMASTRFSRNTVTGFYSAEAGLNVRAEAIREVFVGYNRPSGISPSEIDPCQGGNQGSGDFQCRVYELNRRTIHTYIEEATGNPIILTIPPGERYQNLNAQEYRYTAKSQAHAPVTNHIEAILELRFKSRLVPLFQFAAFYNKDLEILPGPTMTLSGPVHTNGDLYLMSDGNSLSITGQVTTAGDLYRGRKNNNVCTNNPVKIYDPTNPLSLVPSCPARVKVAPNSLGPWHGMIQVKVPPVTVPGPELFDANPSALYWNKADLRLVMTVDSAGNKLSVEVRNSDTSNNSAHSAALLACPGSIGGKVANRSLLYNFREEKWIYLLDVDLQALLNCLKSTNWFGSGKALDDSTEGGLVFHFTVIGPLSGAANNPYGVRIINGAELKSTASGAPTIKGLTIVSDQAFYIKGNYNSINKKPAAIMADSINVLSNSWSDTNSNNSIDSRIASNTTINTAFLAGTDSTGGAEGSSGQSLGNYNGGLENFPRFHENWSNKTLTYRGSFVSLGRPRHVTGSWSNQSYNPPVRDWNYDTSFNNAANLPPITPRFVYLKQELFVRDFER